MNPSTSTSPQTEVRATTAPAVKVGIVPLFSTWVYRCESGPAHLNTKLEELAHQLMRDERNSTRRTNSGGWHYAFDFFELQNPLVTEFHDIMQQHVQGFINHFRPEDRKSVV